MHVKVQDSKELVNRGHGIYASLNSDAADAQ